MSAATPTGPLLWMRHESRPGEGRAPISPEGARRLLDAGFRVVVEESAARVIPLSDYVAAGCETAPEDSWPTAPAEAFIVGLKELPSGESPLGTHIYFGHAYKHQHGWEHLLNRFVAGGGALLDLEYLVDDEGRRLAAFGYWAGYVGAALAVLEHRQALPDPLVAMHKDELDALLAAGAHDDATAVVVGALGRSGRGACDALTAAGIEPTRWDMAETADLDRAALLAHDIFVNCVMVDEPVPPFLTDADLDAPGRRLSVISDVTCDVASDCNVIPVYDDITTWQEPVRRLRGGDAPLGIIAIDNMPTMLPAEATRTYSHDLLPVLLQLPDGPPWQRARATFAAHLPPRP